MDALEWVDNALLRSKRFIAALILGTGIYVSPSCRFGTTGAHCSPHKFLISTYFLSTDYTEKDPYRLDRQN